LRLSVILIAKDEEKNIRACLESVTWADEIVLVDSGSTDATVEIAKTYASKVVVRDWPGYGPQKNRALDLARGEWVLSLDADERVTQELHAEIVNLLASNPREAAFAMPRRSSYCGRFMRHGGWWPDYVVRLFRRDLGRFSDDVLHERVIVDGAVGRLKSPLIHYSYADLEEVLDKVNSYSTTGARMLQERGRRASLLSAVGHGAWTFVRTYVLRLGFLDGREGFMLAVSNAEVSYYRYLKLALLSDQRNRESRR
jgi:glycosyltransferase involved in cell wall biosynthesis